MIEAIRGRCVPQKAEVQRSVTQQHRGASQQTEAQRSVLPQGSGKGTSFSQMLESLKGESTRLAAAQRIGSCSHVPRLTGDWKSSFTLHNPTSADRAAPPQGMGAVSASRQVSKPPRIDKTSELYQQALELESFFVKIMLDSMRSTLARTSLTGKESFAGKMYDDMMYEELSRTVTKTAGLGLADQIYLQLVDKSC